MIVFTEIGRYLQVGLGIGLVIFVHEFGHFIAARLCKVRVELFSLGFGPRIFGWTRGPTTYQLALVPLGGFVKMAGEETMPGEAPLPDELPAKSVGQRFFIYSGGVLMNVVFALLVFPPLLFFGVPFPEPLIGQVSPGGPAWKAGIEPGTRVLAIDGLKVVSFDAMATEIALSSNEELQFKLLGPGSSGERSVSVRPIYDELNGRRSIGVGFAADPGGHVEVEPKSPAFEAGLRSGDHIVAVNGLREDLDETLERCQLRGDPLTLAVLRDEGASEFTITPKLVADKKQGLLIGVGPAAGHVSELRLGSAVSRLGLQKDDLLLLVDHQTIARTGDLERALKQSQGRAFEMSVRRAEVEVTLSVEPLDSKLVQQALQDVALAPESEDTRVAVIQGGAAAKAGILDGDRIVRIGDTPVSRWKEFQDASKAQARSKTPVIVNLQRRAADGKPQYLEIEVVPSALEQAFYGVDFKLATYTYRAGSFDEAVRVGTQSSLKFLMDSWNMLRGLFRGSVSKENLGGIILISQLSYAFAGMGIAKLLFFLCMLSLNLAFLNVLPIPVLDGGHLFFLLIEKVKGSPVNERVLGYSQMVGLVLILGLVVFVTYNDLRRFLE